MQIFFPGVGTLIGAGVGGLGGTVVGVSVRSYVADAVDRLLVCNTWWGWDNNWSSCYHS